MSDLIKIRRDIAANWTLADPVLAAGELGGETDTGKLKLGNGADAWTDLAYVGDSAAAAAAVPVPAWRSGTYYEHSLLTGGSVGGFAPPAAGTLELVPLWIPAGGATADRLSVECTTTGVGAVLRLGIYADVNGVPGNLIREFGTVDASATGERSAVATQALPAGLVWLGYLVDTAAGQFRAYNTTFLGLLGRSAATPAGLISYNRLRKTAVATGALPAAAPAGMTGVGGSGFLCTFARSA